MKPITMMIAGNANPHVPKYLCGGESKPYIKLVAVADSSPVRLDKAKELLANREGVEFFESWLDMFNANPDVDAVMISNDNKYHFEVFKEAIRRKLHIYSMKVPTMDEDEFNELMVLTENYDRTIQVELELHFSPQFRYARKLVKSGALGEIQSIYLTNVSQSPINYFPNWGDPELSYGRTVSVHPNSNICRGGALTDHPHPFDLIRWISGQEFKKVSAVSSKNQRDHLKVEDHVAIIGELDGGAKVFINPSYSNLEEDVPTRRLLWPKSLECNLKITGTDGYYAADYFDKHIYTVGNKCQSPDRLIVDGTGRTQLSESDGLMGSFAACIRGERKEPETTLADSMAAIKVMNAAYKSIYDGCEVLCNK
jgi:predicted dehydrogenase